MEQIYNYKKIEIGRCKDLSNKQFGDYQVLYRTEKPETSNSKQAHWLCQCVKCKKYFIKSAYVLTKGLNECECKYDLTNKHFGRWTVLYKTNNRTKNRSIIWHCRCECGNEGDVDSDTLKKGESKSCGCLSKEKAAEACRARRIDLTGQRFGKLVALSAIYEKNNKHTMWKCKCDCGNICIIDMGNLQSGKSQSCGCTQSRNEEKIIKLLTFNNILFEYQKRFNDFKIKEFDFYVENKYIIEFDGAQHFFASGSGWDTEEHFQKNHNSDLIKNKYCFDNNIPLIRIPYDVNYELKDLKLETTRFLLTPENEKEYYEKRKK